METVADKVVMAGFMGGWIWSICIGKIGQGNVGDSGGNVSHWQLVMAPTSTESLEVGWGWDGMWF